ncbi:MAG: NADH-quinone oxidoreductase subunit J [Planctomycetota bacterium]
MSDINWSSVLFLLFALVACGSAVLVVASSNVARMALYLVVSLSATAGLYFLAGADFVGAMQLMIYVGGTLVLLIFGVMLTAQERFIRMQPTASEAVVALLSGAAVLVLLVTAAVNVPAWRGGDAAVSQGTPPRTAAPLAMALLGMRVDAAATGTDPEPRSGYLLPFELVSIHLLVVLVGASYLARTRIASESLARRPPGGFDQDQQADREAEAETGTVSEAGGAA